ncbi:hypothetical protein [Agitococcus lubricus]|uniref:Uncharacterized protein n=1 Tax=Agitococcus lubricus TaxID=1077255 RepID=A0A2T5IZ67_9GAMM|nr:hypothetical protein [Agitococcus lubricus]PTQ89314.1 hypothetical protein C8N29_10747 [Agitococcus lubricus]
MAHKLVRCWLIFSLFWLLFAGWHRHDLPSHQVIQPRLWQEPKQEEIDQAAFQKTVGGIRYTIEPLYRYELYGLVVSQHDATSWRDYLHQAWQDKLNIRDLCVLWGDNVRSDIYQQLKFWSGQFTCNFSTRSNDVFRNFKQTGMSNNHILASDAHLTQILSQIRLGDQVYIKGYLAKYSHQHGFNFSRGTSTVRTDTGNGACETIYVTDISILQANPVVWPFVFNVSIGSFILAMMMWFSLPFRIKQ